MNPEAASMMHGDKIHSAGNVVAATEFATDAHITAAYHFQRDPST